MSDKSDDLVARIARLEDLEAIRQTWLDYCMRLDSADWGALGDVFTGDAVLEMDGLDHLVKGLDGQYRGRLAIINDFYRQAGAILPLDARPMFVTGHISTNMQIKLEGDEATTLAYFFEIVMNDRVLIGTYQHRCRREADRWRFRFLRIAIRYRARLEVTDVGGQSLNDILARPVSFVRASPCIRRTREIGKELCNDDLHTKHYRAASFTWPSR
jgi:hypothetical protein